MAGHRNGALWFYFIGHQYQIANNIFQRLYILNMLIASVILIVFFKGYNGNDGVCVVISHKKKIDLIKEYNSVRVIQIFASIIPSHTSGNDSVYSNPY